MVHGEVSLGVIDQAEVLATFVDGGDIHEARWVGHISSDVEIFFILSLSSAYLSLFLRETPRGRHSRRQHLVVCLLLGTSHELWWSSKYACMSRVGRFSLFLFIPRLSSYT